MLLKLRSATVVKNIGYFTRERGYGLSIRCIAE